jgi:putative lipoprotein
MVVQLSGLAERAVGIGRLLIIHRGRVVPSVIGLLFTLVGSPAQAGGNPVIDTAMTAFEKPDVLPSYEYALADLNGDGIPDAIVLITDAHYCGSGGCEMLVLRGEREHFRIISSTTITRKPIRVLAESRKGWKSLSVFVAGGGAKPGDVVMRFNGKGYPGNPSMQPYAKAADLHGAAQLEFKQ